MPTAADRAATFPLPAQLSPDAAATLLGELAEAEIGGGAVYDGLVGALPCAGRRRRAAGMTT
ncbi:hypothetical protein GKE82_21335 [Conexibacter sp. W3-3-2]|uniref:hypothetical protein n=1 Tax=Conexibacter sp. W3-3-2 TaxID=2675227 RepID=UPI0012B923F3|nr:hypothetical protein [Conexibacter sp. W3-3-2]MTD46762.1 hypothetical protein [Conexibacter sp. W3-3-2]